MFKVSMLRYRGCSGVRGLRLFSTAPPPTAAPKKKNLDCSVSEKNIIFEDNHLIVLSKPPTLLTQGDETQDEHLLGWTKDFVAKKYNKVGEAYIGLVHRIDRPCSGVVVFAKTSKAANRLSVAFGERDVEKKYICVVHGRVAAAGRCHNMLKLSGKDSKSKVIVRPLPAQLAKVQTGGEKLVEAKLEYKPLWHFADPGGKGECTVLEIDLETGRKHQIRAQLSHIGHPICGDLKYNAPLWSVGAASASSPSAAPIPPKRSRGGKGRARVLHGGDGNTYYSGKGIALHAFSLTVPHPITKDRMTFTAPAPQAWESHFGIDTVQRINEEIMTLRMPSNLIEK